MPQARPRRARQRSARWHSWRTRGGMLSRPVPPFLLGLGFFGVEPVGDFGVLTFEGYTGRFSLLRDKCSEINVTVTTADQPLDELMHDRGHGHRNLAFPRGRQPEIEILSEQLRREGRFEVEVD